MPTREPTVPISTAPVAAPPLSDEDNAELNWLFAWVFVIILISVITRSEIGYKIVYYSLALLVVFLFLTQYKWFGKELSLAVFDLPYNPSTDHKGEAPPRTVPTAYTVGTYGTGGMLPL